jgi:hypothetical protein
MLRVRVASVVGLSDARGRGSHARLAGPELYAPVTVDRDARSVEPPAVCKRPGVSA